MSRKLAIDYGKKRIGVAVTDPIGIIATGLDTIDTPLIWKFLTDYLSKEKVDCFIVGYPKQMNNQPSEIAKDVDLFIDHLNKRFSTIPVIKVDERFTSKIALQTMIDGGLKKKARQNKYLVDKVSATIILQSYLESINQK